MSLTEAYSEQFQLLSRLFNQQVKGVDIIVLGSNLDNCKRVVLASASSTFLPLALVPGQIIQTPRQFYQLVLYRLGITTPAFDASSFITLLGDFKGILVIYEPEALIKVAASLFAIIASLSKLTSLMVVWISRTLPAGIQGLNIQFPQLNTRYIRDILLKSLSGDGEEEERESFVDILLKTRPETSFSLRNLIKSCQVLFPLYLAPIKAGLVQANDRVKLYQLFLPHLKNQQKQQEEMEELRLPFYTKFVLFAAYLASTNPPSTDKTYFSAKENKKFKPSSSSSRAVGPRYFPLYRLIKIYWFILNEALEKQPQLSGITDQITGLIKLGLLSRSGGGGGSMVVISEEERLKCEADFELVKKLADSVSFELSNFIHSIA